MAASAAVGPSFAVICSFLERFGSLLDVPEMSFPQLERYLQDTDSGEETLHLHTSPPRGWSCSVSPRAGHDQNPGHFHHFVGV